MQPHEYLKQADPILGQVIDKIGPLTLKKGIGTPFHSLAESIVYQQLAGKAAQTIFNRLLTLINNELTPQNVSKLTDEQLRSAGLSNQKSSYIKSLAHQFLDNTITPEKFPQLSNEEIKDELIQVKGIGPWTIEMFLMFYLTREDVFAPKDLGLHKAICNLYKKDYPLKERELLEISEKWKPHRTYASLYLWKSIDDDSWK